MPTGQTGWPRAFVLGFAAFPIAMVTAADEFAFERSGEQITFACGGETFSYGGGLQVAGVRFHPELIRFSRVGDGGEEKRYDFRPGRITAVQVLADGNLSKELRVQLDTSEHCPDVEYEVILRTWRGLRAVSVSPVVRSKSADTLRDLWVCWVATSFFPLLPFLVAILTLPPDPQRTHFPTHHSLTNWQLAQDALVRVGSSTGRPRS